MNILVLKTNIESQGSTQRLKLHFDTFSPIKKWTIDTEYIDNVLRVEAPDHVQEKDMVHLLQVGGFGCEVLI